MLIKSSVSRFDAQHAKAEESGNTNREFMPEHKIPASAHMGS